MLADEVPFLGHKLQETGTYVLPVSGSGQETLFTAAIAGHVANQPVVSWSCFGLPDRQIC